MRPTSMRKRVISFTSETVSMDSSHSLGARTRLWSGADPTAPCGGAPTTGTRARSPVLATSLLFFRARRTSDAEENPGK